MERKSEQQQQQQRNQREELQWEEKVEGRDGSGASVVLSRIKTLVQQAEVSEDLLKQLEASPSLLTSPLDTEEHNLFHFCAIHDRSKLLQQILSASWISNLPPTLQINLNAQDTGGFTPLHLAAKSLHIACVETLLAAGADPNTKDGHGRTVLHWAAENGEEELACCILRESTVRVEISAQDLFGRTALHWAAKRGLQSFATLILESGNAALDSQTNGGETVVHWAALAGHSSMLELLLNAGANPTLKNSAGEQPIDVVTSEAAQKVLSRAVDKWREKKSKDGIQNTGEATVGAVKHLTQKNPTKKLKITLKKKQ